MHGLVALFLGVITLAIILLVIRLVALCVLVIASTTIMASIVLIQVGNCCDRVGRFDGHRGICGDNAAGSLIQGYARQEDEPFSFPLAASYPWQSS